MQFYSVSSPPPLIYCILLPTSRILYTRLHGRPTRGLHLPSTADTVSSPELRRRNDNDTRPPYYPAFLYITKRRWQITVCLVGSQPNSLQTQEITPSVITALSNSCPLSANPGSDFSSLFFQSYHQSKCFCQLGKCRNYFLL